MSSLAPNKNISNSNHTLTVNNINNNPSAKHEEIIDEEQFDDDDLKCYQENGLDADDYEDEAELPPLSEEQRLERYEHYRTQAVNRDVCPHSLLKVYKDTVVLAKSNESKEKTKDFS